MCASEEEQEEAEAAGQQPSMDFHAATEAD